MHVKTPLGLHAECLLLTDTGLCRNILIKLPNIKFHENSFSDSRIVTDGRIELQLFASNLPKIGEKFLNILLRRKL
jgi:hypothetical protein